MTTRTSFNEIERKLGEDDRTWKGVVYEIKNRDQVEDMIPRHRHESELRENKPTKERKVKVKLPLIIIILILMFQWLIGSSK